MIKFTDSGNIPSGNSGGISFSRKTSGGNGIEGFLGRFIGGEIIAARKEVGAITSPETKPGARIAAAGSLGIRVAPVGRFRTFFTASKEVFLAKRGFLFGRRAAALQ